MREKLTILTPDISILFFRGDHTESIRVEYDPQVISYDQLLDIFWQNHNPAAKMKRQVSSVNVPGYIFLSEGIRLAVVVGPEFFITILISYEYVRPEVIKSVNFPILLRPNKAIKKLPR